MRVCLVVGVDGVGVFSSINRFWRETLSRNVSVCVCIWMKTCGVCMYEIPRQALRSDNRYVRASVDLSDHQPVPYSLFCDQLRLSKNKNTKS